MNKFELNRTLTGITIALVMAVVLVWGIIYQSARGLESDRRDYDSVIDKCIQVKGELNRSLCEYEVRLKLGKRP